MDTNEAKYKAMYEAEQEAKYRAMYDAEQSSKKDNQESSLGTKAINFAAHYLADMANQGFGALSGAAGIGATIAQPFQALAGGALGNNKDMRANIDANLSSFGANPNDNNFKGGKLASEVALTLPLGGAVGAGAKALGAERLGNAIASGGMTLGANNGNKLANALYRVGGGAINGGLQAGAINPDDAYKGAIAGGSLPIVAKGLDVAGRTINNMVAPLTDKGKNQIIADYLLNKTGDKTDDVISNLTNAKGATAGFNPTVGQASNSADLATLERSFKARSPQLFQDVDQAQRKALADSIRGIGGDEATRTSLLGAREDATNELYKIAKSKSIPVDDGLNELLQRPAISQAKNEAQINALNRGAKIQPITPSNSTELTTELGGTNQFVNGQQLHEVKMALDAARNHNAVGGANKAQLGAIGDAAGDFNNYLENAIPEYGQAKSTFAELSKPINQHDLGNAIVDKYIPASQRDMPSPMQLNREQLAKVLMDNGDKLASHTTGFKGATLKNTLRPDQLESITNAVKDGQLISQGEMLGKGGGSDTTQKLAFNNDMAQSGILSKIAPVGATMNALKGIRDVAYSGANRELEQKLAQTLLNPQDAATLMKLRLSGGKNAKLAQQLIEQATAKTLPVLTVQ